MLVGYPPFWSNKDDEHEELYQKIKTCDYDFCSRWQTISPEAKEFCSKLIEPDLSIRLSAAEALKHKWIKNNVTETPLKAYIIKCLLKHKKLNDF